jgi:hypothetical protein
MKRNGSKIFFATMQKKCFFCLFRIDAKHSNLKRNENGMKQKQNEKKARTAISFHRTVPLNTTVLPVGCAIIFALKLNEAKRKRNFFRFDAKKVLFSLVLH